MSKLKKRSSKNLKINTRIVWTSVLAIIIPVLIILAGSPYFINVVSSYFKLSSVTSNSYSTVNQIQWNQTLSSISDELTGDDSNAKKLKKIKGFLAPLKKYDSSIYISKNGFEFYSTDDEEKTVTMAQSIAGQSIDKNLYYYGENGLVITNKINAGVDTYKIIIANENYEVPDISQRLTAESLSSILLGRTGIIVLLIAFIFIIAIVVISFITSSTIVVPIKKIEQGADEIARGNLDYEIDYQSTNELGKTADSFNVMCRRIKQTTEQAQQSVRQRKEMTAGIAHDLRTPLTSVKGYVEGLRDGIANTPEKQKYYLDTIYESTCQMEKMLDDLMTVSKLELGNVSLQKELINVNEYFDYVADTTKEYLMSKDFDFEYSKKCKDNAFIEIDGNVFMRVFSNIVSNSVKYCGDERGRVRMFVTEYEKNIVIEFEDNGIGVDKSDLTKIFDTMYRSDPARSKTADGSGLGLAVCKQIVELNDGTVWARNHFDSGLSVFISLPKKSVNNEENIDN